MHYYVVKTTFKHCPYLVLIFTFIYACLSYGKIICSLYAHVANIHLYLAMMVGLQNIGGVWILVVVHLYSNAKVNCAHS